VPSFLDAVDAALASYSDGRTIHVDSLEITVPYICGETVPSSRVASWLRFATQRHAGAFFLSVPDQPVPRPQVNLEDDELELPPCEGTTKVYLNLGSMFFLRIPPAGMFGALADLEISGTTMDGQELGVILSSHCPRLQNLSLFVKLVDACDISVRSASLRNLRFCALDTRRLHIAAPMLETLYVSAAADAHIAAPNLAEVVLRDILAQVVIADVGRHLRLLDVTRWSLLGSLMRRFDSVNDLRLPLPSVRFIDYLSASSFDSCH
jgi:hypothetical protein